MRQVSTWVAWVVRAAVLTGAAISSGVLAADPWIGVPSVVNGATAVVRGGALQPYQPVMLRIIPPGGTPWQQSAVADADGSLRVDVAIGVKGAYKVDAYDRAGQRIGGGSFGAVQ